MIANRPKAVFFRRPSKFEDGRPKDGWTVGWLRPLNTTIIIIIISGGHSAKYFF
jgi:hypothetical protein